MSEEPSVVLRGARVRLGGETVWEDVDVEVAAGSFTAVLGPNGSGKTTLLRALLGEVPLAAGDATVLGGPAGARRREIGYLPQRRSFPSDFPIRGIDVVRLGYDGTRWGVSLRGGWRGPVADAIEVVGASQYAARPIGRLSGGEQQRLLIAQALVSRPRLLILDEPLDSLDLPNQVAVAALLDTIRRRTGTTVLLVAHDANPLLPYLDRVIYFGGRRAASGTPAEVITAPTLSRLYGSAIEVLETSDGRRIVVGVPEPPAHHHDRHAHA